MSENNMKRANSYSVELNESCQKSIKLIYLNLNSTFS